MKEELRQSRLIASNAHAVKCDHCELPAFEIRRGLMVVKNRHHGGGHENLYSLEALQAIFAMAEREQAQAAHSNAR